jgi:hypothetical protein
MNMIHEEKVPAQAKSQPKRGEEAGVAAKVHDVAEQARSAANERADSARERVESIKARAAERVRKLSQAVRKIGDHMRIEEQLFIAERATDTSQRLESVASYIDEAELGTLLRDAGDATRRNPGWVLGGAFVVGLAAGRILKTPLADHPGTLGPIVHKPELAPEYSASTRADKPSPRPAQAVDTSESGAGAAR